MLGSGRLGGYRSRPRGLRDAPGAVLSRLMPTSIPTHVGAPGTGSAGSASDSQIFRPFGPSHESTPSTHWPSRNTQLAQVEQRVRPVEAGGPETHHERAIALALGELDCVPRVHSSKAQASSRGRPWLRCRGRMPTWYLGLAGYMCASRYVWVREPGSRHFWDPPSRESVGVVMPRPHHDRPHGSS